MFHAMDQLMQVLIFYGVEELRLTKIGLTEHLQMIAYKIIYPLVHILIR